MKESRQKPPALPERVSLLAQTAQVLSKHIRLGRYADELPGKRVLCAGLQRLAIKGSTVEGAGLAVIACVFCISLACWHLFSCRAAIA